MKSLISVRRFGYRPASQNANYHEHVLHVVEPWFAEKCVCKNPETQVYLEALFSREKMRSEKSKPGTEQLLLRKINLNEETIHFLHKDDYRNQVKQHLPPMNGLDWVIPFTVEHLYWLFKTNPTILDSTSIVLLTQPKTEDVKKRFEYDNQVLIFSEVGAELHAELRTNENIVNLINQDESEIAFFYCLVKEIHRELITD